MQIALLIFCFLTIAGAYAGWRKSPLYSVKTTLKLVGGFLLIVAVVAGTTYVIVNSSLSRSPVAEVVASLIAVIALASGASIFIVRITDSHVAALPPLARLVSFNRHKVYQWIWRLVAFLLINAAASLVLPSNWKWLPEGLAGFVLLLCGPMLSIGYMMARRKVPQNIIRSDFASRIHRDQLAEFHPQYLHRMRTITSRFLRRRNVPPGGSVFPG